MRPDHYATLVFDCDGVILDSNKVKTDAFHAAALPFGEAAAEALVRYHVENGGISRYAKFRHFIDHILPAQRTAQGPAQGAALDDLLARYAAHVRAGLMSCEIADGLRALRTTTPNARWMVASGGDQQELHEVFAARGLSAYFDAGIFGSPDPKDLIVTRAIAEGVITLPALFLGDSRYDHEVASLSGLDFVFISDWTEVEGWHAWCGATGIAHVPSVKALLR